MKAQEMTLERAAEILNPTHREHYESNPVNESCEIGRKAIFKQIPQKPHPIHTPFSLRKGVCPRCLSGEDESANYCRSCGQALDWGENHE